MPDTKQIAYKFLEALASADAGKYEEVLAEDAAMRIARWDGGEAYRPRDRVMKRLMEEWSAWPDPTMETFTVLGEDVRAAVEFRIQATERQRYVEHNRSAFLTIQDGRVQVIDLYCPMPLRSARRKGWIAPATLTEEELKRLFNMNRYSFDVREWIPPNAGWRQSMSIGYGGMGGAHPGGNEVGGAAWTPEEADGKIEELLAYHRDRNLGFHWEVSTFDMPPDLGERLERHGFVRAGYTSIMARVGLDSLEDIPVNPNVEIELVDGSSDDSIQAAIQVVATSFSIPPAQMDQWRPGWYERIKDPKVREEELFFLARLAGKPIGTGRVNFKAGTGHLTSGATLPEYRGKHVYSTMLRRRLEQARTRGYHIVTIDAGPMSRRVVERYGFKEYGGMCIYGWMPVMDLDAIRSLVPQD
jgi:GNAT superfamily N-acetyltransferase/ketosteroid isomerase-like protein